MPGQSKSRTRANGGKQAWIHRSMYLSAVTIYCICRAICLSVCLCLSTKFGLFLSLVDHLAIHISRKSTSQGAPDKQRNTPHILRTARSASQSPNNKASGEQYLLRYCEDAPPRGCRVQQVVVVLDYYL